MTRQTLLALAVAACLLAGPRPAVRADGVERLILTDNTCATATAISAGSTHTVRFQLPYLEDAERRPSCASAPGGGELPVYNTVWARFTAPAGCDALRVSLCGPTTASQPGAALALYRAADPNAPCGPAWSEVACSSFPTTCAQNGNLPVILFGPTAAGETFLINVGALRFGSPNPLTNGDYTLSVTCLSGPFPCDVTPNPSIASEDEYQACDAATRVNDGCAQDPPAFAQLGVGESRRGTVRLAGADGCESDDQDWFQAVVPPPGALVTLDVTADFLGVVRVLRVIGAAVCATDSVASALIGDVCAPASRQLVLALDAGTYYVVIEPGPCVTPTYPWFRDYVVALSAAPAAPAAGACCQGGACSAVSKADCLAGGGVYYGDSAACGAVTCLACPPGAASEGEVLACPAHGYVDAVNGGCDAAPPAPRQPAALGVEYCGTSGTFFDVAPPLASENRRDSDWYEFTIPSFPLGQRRLLSVEFLAEFAAEVLIINPDRFSNPCATLADAIVARAIVPAGVATPVRGVVVSKDVPPGGPPAADHAWLVVRPYESGTPREMPCGLRYRFRATAGPSSGAIGACCLISAAGASQGCDVRSVDACLAAGGVFHGVDASCADVCCPCAAGGPSENEVNCGSPTDTTNGGCNAWASGYPFDAVSLAAPGAAVCGTSAFEGGGRDFDWFVYNHPGGDIRFCVAAQFRPELFIIAPATGTIEEQCNFAVTLAGLTGKSDCEETCVLAWNQPPGQYWLLITPEFGGPEVACGAAYRARVAPAIRGACCLPQAGGCLLLGASECAAAAGVFGGDFSDCGPNPCAPCPLDCDPLAAVENEPACDDAAAPVNGGCDLTLLFGAQLSVAGAVCGTSRAALLDNDNDWYVYHHAGGDLSWSIRGEFHGYLRVIGPVYDLSDLCCPDYDLTATEFAASCGLTLGLRRAVSPGRYHFVVAAARDNGVVACGARYELRVAATPAGACCLGAACIDTAASLCALAGGVFASGATCAENPCAPAVCRGDSDCDGDVDFDDIDFFVAALSGPAAWIDLHQSLFGAAPNCDYDNNDVDAQNGVTFDDIDPFVARIGQPCP